MMKNILAIRLTLFMVMRVTVRQSFRCAAGRERLAAEHRSIF